MAECTDYDEEMFRLGKQIMVDRQEERQERGIIGPDCGGCNNIRTGSGGSSPH